MYRLHLPIFSFDIKKFHNSKIWVTTRWKNYSLVTFRIFNVVGPTTEMWIKHCATGYWLPHSLFKLKLLDQMLKFFQSYQNFSTKLALTFTIVAKLFNRKTKWQCSHLTSDLCNNVQRDLWFYLLFRFIWRYIFRFSLCNLWKQHRLIKLYEFIPQSSGEGSPTWNHDCGRSSLFVQGLSSL